MAPRIALLLLVGWLLLTSSAWTPEPPGGAAPPGCEAVFGATSRGGAAPPSPRGFGCSAAQDRGGAARIARVIDGDTVELADGARVRYIGVDTPERGEPLFTEATRLNRRLVEGREARLARDTSETDRFGRLLRYVYVDDILVNAELVREGLAKAVEYPPDVRFHQCFAALEREAVDGRRGIWAP